MDIKYMPEDNRANTPQMKKKQLYDAAGLKKQTLL